MSGGRRNGFALTLLSALVVLSLDDARAQVSDDCGAPAPVCGSQSHVFVISGFDPIGSAIALGGGQFVTNRHVVADHAKVILYDHEGRPHDGQVIPSGYAGDLILFSVPGVGPEKPLPRARAAKDNRLFAVGADPGRQAVRVNREGGVIRLSLKDRPLSRLHHDAVAGPGNSGGALVNAKGQLVGILTSGGEGRNEAIPVRELERLKALSGERFAEESEKLGLATRQCAERLDRLVRGIAIPDGDVLERLSAVCVESGNRQFIDLAGQMMGRAGRNSEAIKLFEKSLAQDPYAPNALISLVIALHMSRRYEDEIPHLNRLLDLMPDDPQALRLALQAGKWVGDEALTERAITGIETHHPNMAPVAREFLAQP